MSSSLLDDQDPPVFQVDRAHGRSPILLTCDHSGRAIPRRLARLGLSEAVLDSHVAWDLGVAELGRKLAALLDAFLIVHGYSRLVIDANRPPGAPDSIATISERTRVAANEALSSREVRRRVDEIFEPYHRRIRDELDDRAARSSPCILVALHTFTPIYLGEARPWHAGVLYGRDVRLARLVLEALRRNEALVVGDNEPYSVSDDTDYTIVVHGEQRGIPHVELEVRQDLLTRESDVDLWAERIAETLLASIPHVLHG